MAVVRVPNEQFSIKLTASGEKESIVVREI